MSVRRLMASIAVVLLAACSPAAEPVATPAPTAAPSPEVFYDVTKSGEGEHGGSPLLELPADLVVQYTVSGTCRFEVGFVSETTGPQGLPRLGIDMVGPETTGTWHVSLRPGNYYIGLGEAVGCVFHVVVSADG